MALSARGTWLGVATRSLTPATSGDSPSWAAKPVAIADYTSQSPLNRLATLADMVDTTRFLLENRSVNGVDLIQDCGWYCR